MTTSAVLKITKIFLLKTFCLLGGGSYPFPFLCFLISIYFSVFAQPHTKTYLFVTYQRLLG